jgi:hypothetical protein
MVLLVGWIGAFLVAGLLSLVTYWLLHPPKPIGWDRIIRTVAPPRDPIPRAWLELTGLPITPNQLTWINRGCGACVAVLMMAWTLNPIVALAMGSIAMPLPEVLIRMRARKQWQTLDRAAFLFAQALAFFLQQGTSTLEAFRAQLEQRLDAPLEGWVQDAIVSEVIGSDPIETVIKARATRIHHVELMLLGDILFAERHTGHAASLVNRLLEFWASRLDADAKRRGKLKMSMMLGYLMVFGGALGFIVALLMVPALAHAAHHGVGWIILSLAAIMIAGAAYIQQSTARKAEAV